MAWSAPAYPVTGQLITAAFWGAQISDNLLILKTQIDDVGHHKRASRTITASSVVLATDDDVYIDSTAGATAASLPLAASVVDRWFRVKWYAGANLARIACQGSDAIDGGRLGTTLDLATVGDSQDIKSNGSTWLTH